MSASADSISARSFMGGLYSWLGFEKGGGGVNGEEGWREGKWCRNTSVMNVKSEAEFTLGMTRASRCGQSRIEAKSSRARPEETALIRIESSRMEGGRGELDERKADRFFRAWGF